MVGNKGKLPEGAPNSTGPILSPFPPTAFPMVSPPMVAVPGKLNEEAELEDEDDEDGEDGV